MPIYKYKCENGHVFDVMQKLIDAPMASCIECGAPVRKVMQPVNISFRGSGFYSTDYRNGVTKAGAAKNDDIMRLVVTAHGVMFAVAPSSTTSTS